MARVGARHDHGEVDRFRSRIGEVHHPVLALGHGRRQFFSEVRRDGMVEHCRAVRESLRLLHRRLHHGGMGVSDRYADIHAEKIGVFPAFGIPQVLHGTLGEDERVLEWHELLLRGRIVARAALRGSGE